MPCVLTADEIAVSSVALCITACNHLALDALLCTYTAKWVEVVTIDSTAQALVRTSYHYNVMHALDLSSCTQNLHACNFYFKAQRRVH